MEEIPPSYSEAISRDPWVLIAPYPSPTDLFSASLVSKSWNQTFTKVLWGDPASHFTPEKAGLDREFPLFLTTRIQTLKQLHVIDAFPFSRFLQCIQLARPRVRELTYTIDLSNRSSSVPSSDVPVGWFLTIMTILPNVKSIIGPDLPAPDRDSVCEIFRGGRLGDWEVKPGVWNYDLRLLDLRGSLNLNHKHLQHPLEMRLFPNLIYLDLSASTCEKDVRWLFSYIIPHELLSLEILKFRNLNLGEREFERFAKDMGTRLWSLDISYNQLTDRSVAWLVDYCTQPPAYYTSEGSSTMPTSSGYSHVEEVDPTVEDQAWYVARQLKNGYLTTHPSPYAGKGLTHLHISGNQISADSIIRLLRSSNLRVLDVGSLWDPSRPKALPYSGEVKQIQNMFKLTSLLHDPLIRKLSCLRIHHHLITGAILLNSRACPRETQETYPPPYQMASQLGSLQTLILTDVPYSSAEVTAALLSFLSGCADHEHESWLAKTQNITTNEEHIGTGKRHSCLKVLQLEMTRRATTSISITEDPDSDVFLRESQNDFSFFNPDDDSAQRQDRKSSRHISSSKAASHENRGYGEDVIASLTRFRNERRAAHDVAGREGIAGPGTQGCWSGRVKIIH